VPSAKAVALPAKSPVSATEKAATVEVHFSLKSLFGFEIIADTFSPPEIIGRSEQRIFVDCFVLRLLSFMILLKDRVGADQRHSQAKPCFSGSSVSIRRQNILNNEHKIVLQLPDIQYFLTEISVAFLHSGVALPATRIVPAYACGGR
jgi:hypothetical protein